jgi:hypothetical protein
VALRTLAFALALVVVILLTACATGTRPRASAKLLPFEAIHTKVRRYVRLEAGYRLPSCGRLVFYGPAYPPPGQSEPLETIVIADGPAIYFDNRTGQVFARCDYWHCTKHSRYCQRQCPPREWTCEGIAPDPPANTSLEPTRGR